MKRKTWLIIAALLCLATALDLASTYYAFSLGYIEGNLLRNPLTALTIPPFSLFAIFVNEKIQQYIFRSELSGLFIAIAVISAVAINFWPATHNFFMILGGSSPI